ncbi:tRNA lysidine(34) synthetase TilS [candidate division WOR-3 bacterium]|uniref:tRNA(Ile)-lysidine synthase n=1 Tax=candidate division WOR-3 bacterium TaxID=2052148 RepID=A0A660SEF8_UNCW3|nr:MAG: tRNA lysidine(34) synthetase TilS [candidate division WOR-3 bacterium]
MARIEAWVRRTIESFALLQAEDRVLIGFSSGPDSVALLDLLIQLGYDLGIAYIDHGLRPVEDEISLTKQYARRFGIRYYILQIEQPSQSEEALRNQRYQLIETIARNENYHKIALGHTLNDQLETIIINLIRGSTRIRPIPPKRGRIIRPLIEIPRVEIENYLKKRRLPYSHDPSNEELMHTRNVVRKKIIPVLLSLNPGLFHHLAQNIRIWLEEDNFLDSLLPESLGKELDIKTLATYNTVMQRRAVLKWVYENTGLLPESQMVSRLLNLIHAPSGKRAPLKKNVWAIKEFDHLRLYFPTRPFEFILPIPGRLRHQAFKIEAELTSEIPQDFPQDIAYFDLDRLDLPLRVRSWHPGDTIVPFGMRGKKKLKEIWNEARVPIQLRHRIPILVDQTDILWIAGIRRSNKARVTRRTKRILRVVYAPQ